MNKYLFLVLACGLGGCAEPKSEIDLQGTWKLQTGQLIENGDTTVTDYTTGQSFIKIINDTHFAFLLHDVSNGTDSSSVIYSSGGGKYTLVGTKYTEHLEYCTAREWEGHDFSFEITIHGDTLIQQGIEEIPEEKIKRYNTETYVRVR